MKATGNMAKFDNLGRVVIPKPLRDKFGYDKDVRVEVFSDDGGVYIKKYETECFICQTTDNLLTFKDKKLCSNCIKKLKA